MERFLGGLVIGAAGVLVLVGMLRPATDEIPRPSSRLIGLFIPPGGWLDRCLGWCFGILLVVWAVLVWCHAI